MTANQSPSQIDVTPDVRLRLESVATTLETCGKFGIPIDFRLLASDIRAALAMSRTIPPTEEQEVERVRSAIAKELDREDLQPFYRLDNAAKAAIAALSTDREVMAGLRDALARSVARQVMDSKFYDFTQAVADLTLSLNPGEVPDEADYWKAVLTQTRDAARALLKEQQPSKLEER